MDKQALLRALTDWSPGTMKISFYQEGEPVEVNLDTSGATVTYGAKERRFSFKSKKVEDVLEFLMTEPEKTTSFTDGEHNYRIGIRKAHQIILGRGSPTEKIKRIKRSSVEFDEAEATSLFLSEADFGDDWVSLLSIWTNLYGSGMEPEIGD